MQDYKNFDEIQNKFTPKKKQSKILSKYYKRLGLEKKYESVNKCADILIYDVYEDDTVKLKKCMFCKDKLCPLCAWRKELKMYNDIKRVINALQCDYQFLFCTFTIKNIKNTSNDLENALQLMDNAFTKFTRLNIYKRSLLGCLRITEITYDGKKVITPYMYRRKKRYYKRLGLKIGDTNPNYDMLHPHFHCIFCVSKDYYNDNYITQSDLVDAWQSSLGVDYTPVCDIRSISDRPIYENGKLVSKGISGAVAEVSKYAVKSTDYLCNNDDDNLRIINTLYHAIKGKRLVRYYGLIKKVRADFNLDNQEDNLINIDSVGDTTDHGDVILSIYFSYDCKTSTYINYSVVSSIDVECTDDYEYRRRGCG